MPITELSGLHALVVDDDPLMTELVSMLLQDCGLARIHTFASGWLALQHLVAQPAHLLICDLNMPGMDGVQLLTRVAELDPRPAIVLLSGEDPRILDSSRQFAEARRLTVLGVLRKPVAFEPLLALLRGYRPEARQAGGGRQQVVQDEAGLRAGLAQGALRLAYQPKVELRSGKLVGFESLLRWEDGVNGSVPPFTVVAAAESHGLIDELTLAVLDRAARDRGILAARGCAANFAVNLSLQNLKRVDIVERMHAVVATAGGAPSDFTLEVTETHLVDDLAQVLEALIRLRLLGFKISLDDYGTGASTMQLLSQLPSSELKIDRSFVAAGPHSPQGRAFLKSAIELGLQLGQTVVAEGVETEIERALVTELGCQVGQGYLFARPMPLDALHAWAGGG